MTPQPDRSNATRFLDLLFEAYCAGFDNSGEGFNGEYTRDSMRGQVLTDRLLDDFEIWLKEEE